jgi:predicted nucleic acid-binding protein
MRFIDTNVLVYALLEPQRPLAPPERKMIAHAAAIVRRIQEGERAFCSVVHLSEFANIVRRKFGTEKAREALASLLGTETLDILAVGPSDYQLAVEIAHDVPVDVNDCLARVLMGVHGADGIYSFDADFDRLGVARLTA